MIIILNDNWRLFLCICFSVCVCLRYVCNNRSFVTLSYYTRLPAAVVMFLHFLWEREGGEISITVSFFFFSIFSPRFVGVVYHHNYRHPIMSTGLENVI